ncbi:protein SUPPRESSOR OF QUENCHING 1, chloroplastic isoform X1 [Daucus carota subsp. sativus]|uniref:protein SUPPRESSOR OF QUENCHING 1, chloroplastic isoform X1 n=1 Tax=Daucus carota subsp. sativus TaxID=79200 RepID=UPI0007E12A81|nr:PREDICTED: NHL repeat-containing protein 2 isoform X1 [Daucus carota subsp. sativus]XP_017226450.1 PREDICTED: NHL repeat-containing protein 2 isoform X1 [Daucus carota subsp. sativus]
MALTPPSLSLPPSSRLSRFISPSLSNLSRFISPSLSNLSRLSTTSLSRTRFRKRGAQLAVKACVKVEEKIERVNEKWGKVSAVLFDMDGVLCNSEEPSRLAAVDLFDEMGVKVTVEDFIPFMGTGEANFLGGVASLKGVKDFNTEQAKKRFFEIYLAKYAKPNSGLGFPGALELITQCKSSGLKVAVASSADRVKVEANLAASGLQLSMFDAIVSADAFENLKPAPDIFLAASKILDVPTDECIVIEDALAGVQAAKAAEMRCIAVTTTLSEDILSSADPSLVRGNIGNISLTDILSGSSYPEVKEPQSDNTPTDPEVKEPQSNNTPTETIPELLNDIRGTSSSQDAYSTNDVALGGLQGTRRDILRYGSLGISLTCLVFAISNWKSMQYASPKAVWNLLFGVGSPPFEQSEEGSRTRIKQFVNYISDLENKGNAPTVPEFPPKLDWLNTAPLQLSRDLKGKVVLLDFWTYCCINCMHVLPDLEFLERKYKDMPFTVVGVHSAKFDNEKDLEAIRKAVLRYGITHPVVNDGEMYLWRELGISSWPTFAIVSPNGKLIAQISGEGRRKDLDSLVEAALLYYGRKNILSNTQIPLRLEKDNDPRLLASPLKFPGKLAVDVYNSRLFISDSNHNRVVVTDLDGNFLVQIGSTGEEGLRDGNFSEAAFNRPQGLAYNPKKNLLYVADTENHALRVINFVDEMVQTLAGNGIKGSDYKGGQKGNSQLLNSPWDVCFEPENEIVYIAMAGQHQIWEHNTLDGVTRAFSGDGYERNLNGSSSTNTSFAQPSGISLSPDFKVAYIADSESSSIRSVDLKTGGSKLLAGGDPVFSDNLFRFGDHDGTGSEVLLQHPLGVVCGKNGQIYFADSYNHKIKKIDPDTKRVSTLAGLGKAGFKDGAALEAQLSEPSGIAEASNGRLYIADTNNSLIRYLDLSKQEAEISTLELKGVVPPRTVSRSLKRLRRRSGVGTETVKVDGVSSSEGILSLKISVPEGYHFSKEARSKYTVDIEPEDAATIDPLEGDLSSEGTAMLHYNRSSPSASMGKINCKVYYCKEDEVCLYQSLTFEVPFQEVTSNSIPTEVRLSYVVKPKTSPDSMQLPIP